MTKNALQEVQGLLKACPRLQNESGYGVGMKCMLLRSHGMPSGDVNAALVAAPAFFTWPDRGALPNHDVSARIHGQTICNSR